MGQVPEKANIGLEKTLQAPSDSTEGGDTLEIGLNSKVSEVIGESDDNKTDPVVQQPTATSSGAQNMEDRKKQLMASKPPKDSMISEIESVIDGRLSDLKVQERRYRRRPTKYAEQLVEVVSKIRELRRILERIAFYTYEQIKSLWLKIVHNII